MVIASGVLAVIGLGWMIVRSRRVRTPDLELSFDDDALVIRDKRGAVQRAPWSAVTIEKLTHSVSSRMGTYSMPVLVLNVPDRKPLRLGAWDTQLAWPGQTMKTWRAPSWVVGSAQWPLFLDALKRNARL
jgi:hypothetical protein